MGVSTKLLKYLLLCLFTISLSGQVLAQGVAANDNFLESEEYIDNLRQTGPAIKVSAEMAKFYFVVAGMEFTHCLRSNDATACANFIDGLKDPIGHIGFYLFMKGNKWGMSMAEILSRGKISPGMGSYLGLATGMMAQSIFSELYYHPLVEELKQINNIEDENLRDEKRRKQLKKIWVYFKSNAGSYIWNKVPNVLGLLGAAYLSGKTKTAAKAILGKSGKLVKFTLGKNASEAYLRYGRGLNKKIKLAKSGIKFVYKGGKLLKVNPLFAVGSYIVETIIFLAWAPVVEDFFVKNWKMGGVLTKINRLRNKIDKVVFVNNPDPEKSEKLLLELESEHDKFRELILHSARLKQAEHFSRIRKVDDNFEKMMLYYEWLIRGMDKKSELWKSNPLYFRESRRVDASLQVRKFSKEFFCGPTPKDAVLRKKAYRGIPVPFEWGYDYYYDPNISLSENAKRNKGRFQTTEIIINPFQVVKIPGLCLSDTIKLNGGKRPGSYDMLTCPVKANWTTGQYRFGRFKNTEISCRLDQEFIRNRILKTGRFAGAKIGDQFYAELDKSAATALEKIWVHRELMIYTYEKAIQNEMLKAISGRKVSIKNGKVSYSKDIIRTSIFHGGRFPLGLVTHLDWERKKWIKWRSIFPSLKGVFDKLVKQNLKKREAAKKILAYSEKPFFKRVRTKNFFENVEAEEWEKIVRTYREFIIY